MGAAVTLDSPEIVGVTVAFTPPVDAVGVSVVLEFEIGEPVGTDVGEVVGACVGPGTYTKIVLPRTETSVTRLTLTSARPELSLL